MNKPDTRDNGVTLFEAELTKGSNRMITVLAMRTSRAKLDATLSPAMRDAAREISIGYDLMAKGWGYALLGIKTANMAARGGEMTQEAIDKIRQRIGMLHTWEFNSKPDWCNAVKAIEEHGMTAREYGARVGVGHKTIADWYRHGLDDYCQLRGFGKQL